MQALGLVWGNWDPVTDELVERVTDIDSPTQYGARLLLERWRERQAEDGFVVGRDVPSRALASVLRNLAIYEPGEDLKDFRVRLAGTAFTRRFGRDVTGMQLSEMFAEAGFLHHKSRLADIVKTRKPHVMDVRLMRDDRQFLRFEGLRLPVLAPDREKIWVLSGLFYSDWA